MHDPDLVVLAAGNNARWCDAGCRSLGHPGFFTAAIWATLHEPPPFYGNAVTLTRDGVAAQLAALRDIERTVETSGRTSENDVLGQIPEGQIAVQGLEGKITASVRLAACTSSPMYSSIGTRRLRQLPSRWRLLNRQLEDLRPGTEAPSPAFSVAYAAAQRDHPPMMLIPRWVSSTLWVRDSRAPGAARSPRVGAPGSAPPGSGWRPLALSAPFP